MFEDFTQIQVFTPSIFDIAGNMMIALTCGLIISVVYRIVYKGPSYSVTFVTSLILLAMITSVVILVIGNNLARAFGLVGAMSIIRFRTAVRDVQDIIFIFFSLTVGMAAGVGLKFVAIIATVVVSVVIMLLTMFNFGSKTKRRHLLQLQYATPQGANDQISAILKKYCRNQKLVNLKNTGQDDDQEAFYHVSIRKKYQIQDFVKSLNELKYVFSVNLFFDEDDNNSPTTI